VHIFARQSTPRNRAPRPLTTALWLLTSPLARSPLPSWKGASIWEPPIGIEPMTYALRVRRSDRLS
jgi:hypothetical protein